MSFILHALKSSDFRKFHKMSDEELAEHNASRMIVQTSPGTPCRVSMIDAKVGDTVILMNYQHQPANTPYQSSHAIFVRENARQAHFQVNDVPQVILSRLISLRLFDSNHMMLDADVVHGHKVAETLALAFQDNSVAYIHLHYAKPGCFAALATRPQ